MSGQTPEGKVKSELIKFLKKHHCIVRINKQDATTQLGYPDITFFYEGFYGHAELKAYKNSKHRPGQDIWYARFSKWSWCKFVYTENLEEIKKELEEILHD